MAQTTHSYDKKTTYIKDVLSQKEKDAIERQFLSHTGPGLTPEEARRRAKEYAQRKQKQAV